MNIKTWPANPNCYRFAVFGPSPLPAGLSEPTLPLVPDEKKNQGCRVTKCLNMLVLVIDSFLLLHI
jgi:hypothetical protein